MRRLLEGALDELPVGADRDHLCAAIRAESDSLDEWGSPFGTPGTCDGSWVGKELGRAGGNLNELCGCSCPHVLNICEEGVRRTSSLPGLVGAQLTEMLASRSSCELWLGRLGHVSAERGRRWVQSGCRAGAERVQSGCRAGARVGMR